MPEVLAPDYNSKERESFTSFAEDSGNGPRNRTSMSVLQVPAGPYMPEMTSNLGTTAWCAPELFTSSTTASYSLQVDVYSFGMVLWEMWERKKPYEELQSRYY